MKQSGKIAAPVLVLLAVLLNGACDDSGSKDSAPWDAIRVTGLTAKNDSIDISWKNPSNSSFDHVEIGWSLHGEPVDSVAAGDGLAFYSITGLAPETEYDITMTAVDDSGNWSADPIKLAVFTTGGTERTYGLIYTLSELNAVRVTLNGTFLLMADLDLDVAPYNKNAGWTPVGSSAAPFTGTFNGNNHVVKNMFINDQGNSHRGFFGYTDGAEIHNLGLESVNVTGGDNTGGLAGWSDSSTLIDCYTDGSVSGNYSTGGLVGFNIDSALSNCYSSAAVTGNFNCTGGLVGANSSSEITNCFATGSVTGRAYTGGLIGWNAYASVFTNCYAAGEVTASIATVYKGGLLGYDYDASNTYTSCFYDTTATGMSAANQDYGTPASTAAMKTQSTFTSAGWDFAGETINGTSDIWSIDGAINSGYPYLRDNHQ